jgi:hypothetical protein
VIIDTDHKRDRIQIFAKLIQEFVGFHGTHQGPLSRIYVRILQGFHRKMEENVSAFSVHGSGDFTLKGTIGKDRKGQHTIESQEP